ncbi:hypothetical protein ACLOJK_004456 [Asimina triloba]
MLSRAITGLLRDAFMSALLEEARSFSRGLQPERYVQELLECLDRCRLDALIGVDDDPCLIGAENNPRSRQGGQHIFKVVSLRELPFLRELPSSLSIWLWGAILELIRRGRTVTVSRPALFYRRLQPTRPIGIIIPAFNVPPAHIATYSWKVIQTMAWCYEHRGYLVDRYLWRELLTRWLSQGYVEFLAQRDMKGIDNPPDCMPRWEARFFLPG